MKPANVTCKKCANKTHVIDTGSTYYECSQFKVIPSYYLHGGKLSCYAYKKRRLFGR